MFVHSAADDNVDGCGYCAWFVCLSVCYLIVVTFSGQVAVYNKLQNVFHLIKCHYYGGVDVFCLQTALD